MSKPASILKKQRQNNQYDDRFNESVTDWHQPYDLDLGPTKQVYSPIGTPPRLRTYVVFFEIYVLQKRFLYDIESI
jgi:hypothetical protein